MPESDPVDAFYQALDESPGDRVTTLALADWYEEQGTPHVAECLRWAVEQARWPFRYRRDGEVKVSSAAWHDGWYWWALEDPFVGKDWGHPPSCRLPKHIWERLKHTFDYDPAVFKEYPHQRAAFEALFAVWPAVRRQK